MPSIGTLVGFLKLDDSQYNRALKAAQSQTRAFASGLTSAFLRIAGPAALTAGLVSLGRRAIETADRFNDLATRINSSFEGVQVLEALAKDFGNSAEIFTAAGDRIQQALLEAANGNEKAALTFRDLGIVVAEFANLKLERQLEVLARAVVNSSDQQRAFLAVTELIGTRAAPQLKQALISLGTEGYDAFRDKAAAATGFLTQKQGEDLAQAKRQIEDFTNFLTIKVGQILAGGIKLYSEAVKGDLDGLIREVQAQTEILAAQLEASEIDSLAGRSAFIDRLQARIAEAEKFRTASNQLIIDELSKLIALLNSSEETRRIADLDLARQAADEDERRKIEIQRQAEASKRVNEIMAEGRAAMEKLIATDAERLALLREEYEAQRAIRDDVRNTAEVRERSARAVNALLPQIHTLEEDIADEAERAAEESERAAKAAGAFATNLNNAAAAAERITLPGGSRPDGPSRPTPPNPPGSGMTNQEWKEFYRNNPEMGDAFRGQQKRIDPNSNEGRAQRQREKMDGWNDWVRNHGKPPSDALPTTPDATPDPSPESPADQADLPGQLAALVKQLKVIGDKLTVA